MAIKLAENNIFATGYIVEFPEGDSMLQREPLVYDQSASKDSTHLVKEGDTLYTIAYRKYGDDKLWHIIADVNNIYDPFNLELGIELLIPDLDVAKASRR